MRRLLQLLLLVFFVTASATGVRASTDCERWFIAYKLQLAHTKSVQRIEAARRRARRRLANYIKPKTTVTPIHHRRPPMSREETLRHFNLACGVLPEESADQPLVSEEAPVEFAPDQPQDDFVGLIPAEDGEDIAENDVPPFSGGGEGGSPSEGGPAPYYPTTGGVGGGPGGPGTSGTPGGPVVPEPDTYVFMLTGMVAAAGVVRRRFNG